MDDSLFDHEEADSPARWQRMLHDSRPTDYFIDLALTTGDPAAYVDAIVTLQLRGTPDVLAAARELCGSLLPHERKLGVSILSRLGDTAPLLRVARRLRMSGDETLRAHANRLLARLDAEDTRTFPKEALAILLPMLDTEVDIDTLRELLCAGGGIPGIPPLHHPAHRRLPHPS